MLILEHAIRADWKLVAPAKATEKSRDVYRFQVVAPAGKTVSFDVAEDQTRIDHVALETRKNLQPYYAVAAGILVKPLLKTGKDELLSLKIAKGVLVPTYRVRESKAYIIQNNGDEDRTFTVDHVILKGYKRLDKDGDQVGPAVHRFQIKVAAHKTGLHEVIEQRENQDRQRDLRNVGDELLHEYQTSPVVGAKVKAALQKYAELRDAAAAAQKKLSEQKLDLKILSDDQARLRENLKIVPPTSEPYKDFLKKFVALEGEIEALQKQVRQQEAVWQKQERAVESYVNGLTAE
jgi:hypothetical protein